MKDVSGNRVFLSMGALTVELEARSPLLRDPKGYIKEGSGKTYSFQLGNLEGKFNYRGLRGIVKEGSGNGAYLSLSGTSSEGSFTGQHEGHIKEGSRAGHLSP
jgi:hypothetical protein